ncbi:MAG: hypothetical protein KBD46_01785 [Candidatus Levybacteria bacterium]|nr:hypothetical protein [Candidatus Levybacteria bacterium]
MNTLAQADIFFFISSIGFVVVAILIAIFLFYLIRSVRAVYRIMEKIEKDIVEIGDTTREMVEGVQDSVVFRFLFGKKKKSARKNIK